MKEKIDFAIAKAIIKKDWAMRIQNIKRRKNVFGFILQFVLILGIIVLFGLFFGKFLAVFQEIPTNNVKDPSQRKFELLSILFSIVLILMTLHGLTQIGKEVFSGEDLKLYSAMPISKRTIFVAKLFNIFISQLIISIIVVLTIDITILIFCGAELWFYLFSILLALLLPVLTVGLSALFALPYHAIKQFLKSRFLLNFITICLILISSIFIYSYLLTLVKEMLLGSELRYFFDEKVMSAIGKVASSLYPGKWIAQFLLKQDLLFSGVGLLVVMIISNILALILIDRLLTIVMQSKIEGKERVFFKKKGQKRRKSTLSALIKKEFVTIFRSPVHMFSYFSGLIIMPLMVYFCFSIGSSLIIKLIGVDCSLEIGVFLFLLFGSLTNIFCSASFSREGEMFYSLKALPLNFKSLFFSKILLCLFIPSLSAILTALILFLTNQISVFAALFLAGVGILLAFAQICFAIRYDFNHAKFELGDYEEGQLGLSSSVVIILGLLFSALLGGGAILCKLMFTFKGIALNNIIYIVIGGVSILAAILSFAYLMLHLKKKYLNYGGEL